ncbi:MAG: hypothetical protein K6G80_10220 [Treponema sp.]|nr:hypothetical protein [Treponema sp.]
MEDETEKAQTALRSKFDEVSAREMDLIESYVFSGYKETLSRLLVFLGKDRAEAVLSKLPEMLSGEVRALYAEMSEGGKKNTDADIMAEAGAVLKRAGFYGKATAEAVLTGLTGLEARELPAVCKAYYEKNPLLSLNVDRYRFSFEDIVSLDDRAMQKTLQLCDSIDVAKALKGASKDVKEKFQRNFSRHAWTMLEEDMEFMGPVHLHDVYGAQQRILAIVKGLEENGEIVIARNDDGRWLIV